MQLLVLGIDPVDPRQHGGGFLLLSSLFEERGELLEQSGIAAAYLRITRQLGNGMRLVLLGEIGVGEKFVGAAGFDVIGIDVADGGGFAGGLVMVFGFWKRRNL